MTVSGLTFRKTLAGQFVSSYAQMGREKMHGHVYGTVQAHLYKDLAWHWVGRFSPPVHRLRDSMTESGLTFRKTLAGMGGLILSSCIHTQTERTA